MRLRDYQTRALGFCLCTPRAYLAARPGAGKTAIGLHYAQHVLFDSFDAQRVLIVAPLRVVPQWGREARKWPATALLTFAEYIGVKSHRASALAAFASVLVVSFEYLEEVLAAYKGKPWPFDLVIFDEASRLRNGGQKGSRSWKMVNAISKSTDARLLLLSGSPRPGTAHELFGPVFLLDRGRRLGSTLTKFRADWLEPDKQSWQSGQVFSWKVRAGQERPMYDRIADLFHAVSPDLGLSCVEVDRFVDLPTSVMGQYRVLKGDAVLPDWGVFAGSAGVLAGKLHQLAQGCVFDTDGAERDVHDEKLRELGQIVDELEGAPVVVCYWYTHDLRRLQAAFPAGRRLDTEADLAAARAGQVPMAFLHPASAGHGIDGLQYAYSNMVFFCLPDSFELYDQACARIVRSGQRETVSIFRIVARGTVDELNVLPGLERKRAEQDQFFQVLEGEQ